MAVPGATTATTGSRATVALVDAPEGKLELTTTATSEAETPVTVEVMSEAETGALLGRLEPLPPTGNPARAPTMRAPTPAPVPAGGITPIAFVAPTGKAVSNTARPIQTKAAALTPPQITPIGEVARESTIRIRFSDAMVAVAAVGTPVPAPATVSPSVAGTWRWLDTRVVELTPTSGVLAQATSYVVTVPEGTRSLAGAVLAEATTQEFTTSGVRVASVWPGREARIDSAIAIRFDQRIDPAAIVPFVRVTDQKGRAVKFRRVELAEANELWAKNPALQRARSELAFDANTIFIAPTTAWTHGDWLKVRLISGAPSLEGPIVSEESAAEVSIVQRFVTDGVSCDGMEVARKNGARCPAQSVLNVSFSNPHGASFASHMVQIVGEPLQDYETRYGVALMVPPGVGSTHEIRIKPSLVDAYGQSYEGASKLSFVVAKAKLDTELLAETGLQVLDPRFQIPQWVVHAQAVSSLRVQLYQVTPDDYDAFAMFEAGARDTPPGTRVHDETHKVGRDYAAALRVDLRPALANGTGHVVAVAAAGGQRRVTWIQVTKLGLSARTDQERAHVWVHDLAAATFLRPVLGATISSSGTTSTTDAEGHATFELPAHGKQHELLLATNGTDSTFTVLVGAKREVRTHSALWHVTDDRFTYKPGESVYVKGWVRWTHSGVNPQLASAAEGTVVEYSLEDSRRTKLGSGTTTVTSEGGFDLELAIPATANLGTAVFTFQTHHPDSPRAERETTTLPIDIQEFRTPAFAVTLNDDVTHAGATPLVVGEAIEMSVEAKYYAGGGLPGARVHWDAMLTESAYRPPGWDRYAFTPPEERGTYRSSYNRVRLSALSRTTLTSASTATARVAVPALPRNVPAILAVDSTVTDVDRMAIRASSRPILVHPSTLYVGLRKQPGTATALEVIVTDIDGAAVPGVAISVELEGVLGSERDRAGTKILDTQRCQLTSAATAVVCPYQVTDRNLAYTATARVRDDRKRPNAAQIAVPWWGTAPTQRELDITTDKPSYQPGETAILDIYSNSVPARAHVTFSRQGVFNQQSLELTQTHTSLKLPIEPGLAPNVYVRVDRVASTTKQPTFPDEGTAHIEIPIDVSSLALEVTTRATDALVEPGEDATFEVAVKRADQAVTDAEVALMVIDEGVLALSGKSHTDPLRGFYPDLGEGTNDWSSYDLITNSERDLTGTPGFSRTKLSQYGMGGYGVGGLGARSGAVPQVRLGSAAGTPVIKARKDFRATAVFSPRLRTDKHGKARVTVKMPDSLTRFRIVAIAAADTFYFGKGEGAIVTQRKVTARTMAPRFLTQGDTFSLPVVVQNLDRVPRSVDVVARAANLISTGPQGKRVTVPGGQRVEVRFDFATEARGKAIVQTAAVSGSFADSSIVTLPVYEPATTESFATYGVIDDKPAFERLDVPSAIFPDVGGVELELASTQLQSLTDAVEYLDDYPFDCAEQRSGRMIANAAVGDILEAFAAPGRPTPDERTAQRERDVKALTRAQNSDGGWGYWRFSETDPFVTAQVLRALGAIRDPSTMTRTARTHVMKHADRLIANLTATAARKLADRTDLADHPIDVAIAAHDLVALQANGVDVRARAAKLDAAARKLGAYPIDAKARLLPLLAAGSARNKLLAELVSTVHETASAATVAVTFTPAERWLLVSETRTTALVLDALIAVAPDHAVIPKLARGLLEQRKRGRWYTTQENLAALVSLRHYFDAYEKATPAYTATAWLGTAGYAEQAFAGRGLTRAQLAVDWTQLTPGVKHDVAIARQGTGRLYYRLGITYAPVATDLPALDAGFVVRRTYRAVDDPNDVTTDQAGVLHIKLGARVVVVLEATATQPRYGVAVVDPLPAGLEPVNEALVVAERAVDLVADTEWDHHNMRDNRIEAFRMQVPAGTQITSYTARATTPGSFFAAPAKAEEMYSPETFGRSTGTRVVIE